MNNMDSMFAKLEAYIKSNFESSSRSRPPKIFYSMRPTPNFTPSLVSIAPGLSQEKINHWIEERTQAPFKEVLFAHIDTKYGGNDAEIYKRAGIDRKLFSKIRTSDNYIPNKTNVIALVLALKLAEDEAETLILAAGYSLSPNRRFDLVIRFCIEYGIYDLMHVNELLYHMGLKTVY